MSTTAISRRGFLGTVAAVGGGLLLSSVFDVTEAFEPLAAAAGSPAPQPLNAWVRIGADDRVTLVVSQVEMGQGIQTTLPAVLAEELGADWSRVSLEAAPVAAAYQNPRIHWQFTGNSESTSSFFLHLRKMGAAAREMLTAEAAERWKVPAGECAAEGGQVHHRPTGRSLSFGELAAGAARRTPPAEPALKPRSEWRLLGRPLPRLDTPGKVDGSAVFGIDTTVPGMLHAAVRMAPSFGGKLAAVDKSSIAGAPGVVDVVQLPDAVAVVAATWWEAKQAVDRLAVTFTDGPEPALDSASLAAHYQATMDGDGFTTVHTAGDPEAARKNAAATLTGEYESQFLAHATMEPMNATAEVTADGCDIWAPTQGPELAQVALAAVLGLPREAIRIHTTLVGGGFGRRLVPDFVVQAALVARAVKRPVQVLWSREDDMQHDLYRPAVRNRITASLDSAGRPLAVTHRLVSPTILAPVFPIAKVDPVDPSCVEGTLESEYRLPASRVEFRLLKIPVPTSVLRTTGFGPNLFAFESFVDEMAAHAGVDPWLYRHDLLADSPRGRRVLDLAAEKAGWSRPAGPGIHRGIAFAKAFGTFIAQVVELSVDGTAVRVHRVVSAVDCGTLLDPVISTSAIEGGVVWGLSAALKSEITFAGGRTAQRNFYDYQVLRLSETPELEVHFVESEGPLGGVGEVGPVAVVPALANALFAATGRRFRTLPLSRHGFRVAARA